jgi:hypothetical protein
MSLWERGLGLAAAGPQRPRTRVATFLVVRQTDGMGLPVQLNVDVVRGEPSVVCRQHNLNIEAANAAEVAARAALAPLGAHDAQVIWSFEAAGGATMHLLEGPSLALAMAVAARAAWLDRPVPPGWAFTGGLKDGRVARVHGVPAKLRAAAAHGVPKVALPAENLAPSDLPGAPPLTPPEGVTLFGVTTAEELLSALGLGVPWWARRRQAALLAALVGLAAALAVFIQVGEGEPPGPPPSKVELTISEGVVWVFSERLTGEGEAPRRLTPGVAQLPLHDGLGCVSLIWSAKDELLDGEVQNLLNQGPDCESRDTADWAHTLGAAPSLVEIRFPEATMRLPVDGGAGVSEIVHLPLRW